MSIAAKMQLGAIETDGLYAKTNLALTRFGEREFVKLKNFGGTGLMKANYLCSFSTQGSS